MATLGMTTGSDDMDMLQPSTAAEREEDASDEEPIDDDELLSDSEPEKDETELELERLVFGDQVGFREEIKSFRRGAPVGEDGDNTLTAIDSADVRQSTPLESLPACSTLTDLWLVAFLSRFWPHRATGRNFTSRRCPRG